MLIDVSEMHVFFIEALWCYQDLISFSTVDAKQPRVVFTRIKAIGDDFTSEDMPPTSSSPKASPVNNNVSAPKLQVLSDVVSATVSTPGLVKKISFRLRHKNVKEVSLKTPKTKMIF